MNSCYSMKSICGLSLETFETSAHFISAMNGPDGGSSLEAFETSAHSAMNGPEGGSIMIRYNDRSNRGRPRCGVAEM